MIESQQDGRLFGASDAEIPVAAMIKDAAEVLPKQAILENFVHHNPWEIFQNMDFFQALEHVEKAFSTMSPGARLFALVNVDPRNRANTAIAELGAVFLDRGVAKWRAPHRERGFLYFFASLECLGFAPWRAHSRAVARRITSQMDGDSSQSSEALAHSIILENLKCFCMSSDEWVSTIQSMFLDLPGWGGMFERMEMHACEAPELTNVRLHDFCAVQSILLRSSVESLARGSGWDTSTPLGSFLSQAPTTHEIPKFDDEFWQNPSGLAYKPQNCSLRPTHEKNFCLNMLAALGRREVPKESGPRPVLQIYTCIDEREESFRRHLEQATGKPHEIETFGVPGFFGLPIWFKPANGAHPVILAPEGTQPPHTLVEEAHPEDIEKTAQFNQRRRFLCGLEQMWENLSFSPIWSLVLALLFPITTVRLFVMSFMPITTRKVSERLYDAVVPQPRTDFQLPFTTKEGAKYLSVQFKNIGSMDRFSRIVIVLGHGSRSVNNPFDAAHNCGACGGQEGGPNARLFARCANNSEVRIELRKEHKISIPDDTWFVGGYHDTTSDLVEIFDMELVPSSHADDFTNAMKVVHTARANNALERCQKFMGSDASNVRTPQQALSHVQTRSTDLGQARPELGHATNASVILGRRNLTKGIFFDRRLFMPSYDPFNDDDNGTNLEQVIAPALIVCSGISLEYLFSTIEGGAGTKVPMNIVGNFSVMQGTAGDLLVGLPTQMTEMHSPLRAFYLIDAPVKRVQAVLARRPPLRDIVHNDWVCFYCRDPNTGKLYKQSHGQYTELDWDLNGVPDPDAGINATINLRSNEMHRAFIPFTTHLQYCKRLKLWENLCSFVAATGMLVSCGLPIYMFGGDGVNMPRRGPLIAVCGTFLAICALTFSRRYLHGEFMFGRYAILSATMLTGFNLIAVAPTLKTAVIGWNFLSFSSTFLIGVYNDRPTARENATFAFVAYAITDCAMLVAAAFAHSEKREGLVAVGLLVAAMLKSSQFPLTNLLTRSMEGPMPCSALGYTALSAHAGVVLLSTTTKYWFVFHWARTILASFGLITAISQGFVSKVRADRKGSVANATVATLGMIYVIVAIGATDLALVLSFGHASFRMLQVLRSANLILDHHILHSSLGPEMHPKVVPDGLYRLSWILNRMNTDCYLPHVMHLWGLRKCSWVRADSLKLGKWQQWFLTGLLLTFAGLPITPLAYLEEDWLMEKLHVYLFPVAASMMFHTVVSTCLVWFVFARVLDFRRFRFKFDQSDRSTPAVVPQRSPTAHPLGLDSPLIPQ